MSEQVNSLNIPVIQGKKISFKGVNPQAGYVSANVPQGASMQGMQASAPAASQTSAPMQGNPNVQNIQQTVGETQLGNRVKNSSEIGQSPYTLPVAAGTWYVIAQGMDKFGKASGGVYETSLLGKVTGAGDRISNAITESALGKSPFGQFIGKIGTSVGKYFDKVTNNPKNRLFYALRNTHTRPECKLVIGPAAGAPGYSVMDNKSVFEYLLKPIENAVQLKQYGKDNTYIENFLKSVEGLPKSKKLHALQMEELKYFGVKAEDVAGKPAGELTKLLRDLKITKGLGFANEAQYKQFLDEGFTLKNLTKLRDILKGGDQNLKVLIWKKDGFWGKIFGHAFGREVSLQEIVNKLTVLTDGGKTKLGRIFGKSFAYLTEGTTNRFAGGKLGVFMQATIFADMLIHTFNAPKGEKGKTLAERFVNDFTYFLAIPLGVGLMHMAGGLKYLGMSKEQVEGYRQKLKILKDHADLGDLSKGNFKLRRRALKKELIAGVKNPFLRVLKKAAKILTVGIERLPEYKSKDKYNLNWLRKSRYFGNNALGYAIRFIIPMFMLSPMFAKWTTQATHKIFGRPTHSVLDEDTEEEQPAQNSKPAVQQAAAVKPQTITPAVQPQNSPFPQVGNYKPSMKGRNPQEYSDTNLIKQTINGQKTAAAPIAPSGTAQQPVSAAQQNTQQTSVHNTPAAQQGGQTPPAAVQKDPNAVEEPVRTYIPSPQGVVIQPQDMSSLDKALANADAVEKQGYEVLKSV